MQRRKVAIDIIAANKFSIGVLLLVGTVFTVLFFLLWPWKETLQQFAYQALLFAVVLFLGIPVHEGIHGLTWGLVNRNFRKVSFGVIWKYMTPYCHYSEPMSRCKYIVGAVMPFIFLGLVPIAYALWSGSFLWLLFGIIFIGGATGDLWMTLLILKEPRDALFLDHPSEAGFYVIENDDPEE
ncbi:MAG: DUF3267 domain-containing protein [Prevotella sp.]|jgi:hypothetical protein